MDIRIEDGEGISQAIKRTLIRECGVAANNANFDKASIWMQVMNAIHADEAGNTISHNGNTQSIGSKWDDLKKNVIVHADDMIKIADTTWNKILGFFGVNVQTSGNGNSAVVTSDGQGDGSQGGGNTQGADEGLSPGINSLKTLLSTAVYEKDDVNIILKKFDEVLRAENPQDSTFIKDLITKTTDLDRELALVICQKIDIRKLDSEQKTALQSALVDKLKEASMSPDDLEAIKTNGWIDDAEIKGRRHGTIFRKEQYYTTGTVEYTCGDKTFRVYVPSSDKNSRILREINNEHAEMGVQLFADVVGANGPNSGRHTDAKKIIKNINKDNVIEVIRSFNMASKAEHDKNYQGIFSYLTNEVGLWPSDYRIIIDYLKAAAGELNPDSNFPDVPQSGITPKYLKELDEWCKENIR